MGAIIPPFYSPSPSERASSCPLPRIEEAAAVALVPREGTREEGVGEGGRRSSSSKTKEEEAAAAAASRHSLGLGGTASCMANWKEIK